MNVEEILINNFSDSFRSSVKEQLIDLINKGYSHGLKEGRKHGLEEAVESIRNKKPEFTEGVGRIAEERLLGSLAYSIGALVKDQS